MIIDETDLLFALDKAYYMAEVGYYPEENSVEDLIRSITSLTDVHPTIKIEPRKPNFLDNTMYEFSGSSLPLKISPRTLLNIIKKHDIEALQTIIDMINVIKEDSIILNDGDNKLIDEFLKGYQAK